MDARELRIGNFVLGSVFGGKGESVWVHFEGEVHTTGKDVIKLGDGVTFPIESLSGIPLTEEWLIKLGCIKHVATVSEEYGFETQEMYTYDRFTIFYPENSGNEFDDYENGEWVINNYPKSTAGCHFITTVKTVHELQNLLHSLTGEELNIKS